jgi:hypothetical protein
MELTDCGTHSVLMRADARRQTRGHNGSFSAEMKAQFELGGRQ